MGKPGQAFVKAREGTWTCREIFPDRVTVSSPGGLFGNVRIDTQGLTEATSSRNARLAVLLQEAGDPLTGRPVAENRGSGIPRSLSLAMFGRASW